VSEAGRYLILSVDRDDDLEVKTKIRTPIQGREEVQDAAIRFALADPEEADANALFASIKKYEELKAKGVECEVASVCGTADRGFDADRKIRREVEQLLSRGNYTGIILVSDGGDDEHVIPVLQTLKPIVSVERIVIKHSKTVEETYLVLGRYLRMLVFDPRYSKWFLGVPGLMLLLAGVLVVSGRFYEAQLATLLILGGAFFIRGFGIDRWIAGILSTGPYGYIRIFSIFSSGLVVLVGVSLGVGSVPPDIARLVSDSPNLILVYGAVLFGYFLKGALPFIWAGMGIYATGALLAHLVRGSVRVWRDGVVLVVLALLYLPMDLFSTILIGGQRESTILLISYVLVGLAVIFGVTSTVYARLRLRSLTKE
jgi:putative membrane protein